MEYRLQKNVKDALRKRFSSNLIYKAFKAPCEKYEAMSKGFRLSPEEVFYEVMTAFDDIIENQSDAVFNYQDFWNDKYNEYRDFAQNESDEGIKEAVSLVVNCLYFCLDATCGSLDHTISLSLTRQLDEYYDDHEEMEYIIWNNITLLGLDNFREFVNHYYYSEDFITDEIEDIIEETPQEQKTEVTAIGNGEQLSLRQLLLLLDVGFDVGFTKETTNVSAYSKLVAKMIGGNPESIRTTMNRLKNIDYDSKEIKEDVKKLIPLVEPVKVELANKLRKYINEV